MEGVSFALYQCMELCEGLGLKAEELIASGGGARSKPWLQIQSDIYNMPLKVADTEEQAGLGAAIAAGRGSRNLRFRGRRMPPGSSLSGFYRDSRS